MSEEIDVLKEEEKEKLAFNENEFEVARPDDNDRVTNKKSSDRWIGGMILISIGIIFLLANTTDIYINNWWALFILIPGVATLAKAVRHYKDEGHFSNRARSGFTWGLILCLVAATFIFNWDWGFIWPVFLIIFGLGALLSGLLS